MFQRKERNEGKERGQKEINGSRSSILGLVEGSRHVDGRRHSVLSYRKEKERLELEIRHGSIVVRTTCRLPLILRKLVLHCRPCQKVDEAGLSLN